VPKVEFGEKVASFGDLDEGPRICIMRLRQLKLIVQDTDKGVLWPLALTNVATCMEWFARSLVKHLIDYSADRINPNARILKDLKINYGLIVQAGVNHYSIGDIVAMSRNFSSFDEIDGTLNDLTKKENPSILARATESWSVMMSDAFRKGAISRRTIELQLNSLFEKRNELIHGSPRHLAYDDQLNALVSERDLIMFIHCAIEYMRHVLSTLAKFLPEINARTTLDHNRNHRNRLQNCNEAIKKLERAIESRLAGDATDLTQFRRAQHSWRTWRNREADFQTTVVWGPAGSGRPALYMGFETTLGMDRLRSLESYLRELDRQARGAIS
jgi:hypothetical protein